MCTPASSFVSLGDLARLDDADGVTTAGTLCEAGDPDTDTEGGDDEEGIVAGTEAGEDRLLVRRLLLSDTERRCTDAAGVDGCMAGTASCLTWGG